ncbi:alpha/beta fold hydrolase [Pelomonas sp. CA6]|uniref:alpha/beta hydrolase n=1 Tax=Pelomonas sp. CA6 TaxID=2907999 RepID=UPI001F4A0E60|nr:alpha/beta hydrolase [Pelomonas sp. CA6]MCH7342807.1 alpha/beta fold hydrolase [Pelomonas sp. CA6]
MHPRTTSRRGSTPAPRAALRAALAGALLALPMLPAVAAPGSAGAALQPCRIAGVPNEVLCGQLQRPLDPARPQATQIQLRYVVIPALARNKKPDPVLMLAGGPGQSAVALAGHVLQQFSRLNNRRDLVLVDQRGTGESAPLQCDENPRLPLSEAMNPERQLQRLAQCRDALQKLPHGDLRQYSTPIAMQDMDAVRQALGVAQWNVVGASYGTRAALEYLRQFPQQVRRVVIDGVAPPDMALPQAFSTDGQAALDAVLDACAQDSACHARFPALRGEWQALLAGLPRRVSVTHAVSGETESFELTRAGLLRAVRPALYAPALASALPAAIHAAHQGRLEGLLSLAAQLGGGSRARAMRLAMGMHFSVVCAEDLPLIALSKDPAGRDFGTVDGEFYGAVCRDWPRASLPGAFYQVPPSRSPVLVLSGGADPATPPRHGERIAKALGAQARHLVVPQAGHGVMGLGCMRDLLYRFIDAETAPDQNALQKDAQCATRMPRPPAFLPPLRLQAVPAATASDLGETR